MRTYVRLGLMSALLLAVLVAIASTAFAVARPAGDAYQLVTARDSAAVAEAAIGCGDVVTGSIDAPGEEDLIDFVGEAGDIVSMTLAQTGEVDPSFWVRADLLGPSDPVPPFVGFLPGQGEVQLPETGTYTLKLYDWQHEYRGSYAVGLEWIAPVAKQCDTLQIACGQVSEGDIGQPAEADLFNFAGEAGDVVSITLAETGEVDPSYWVRADLFTEGGAPVFEDFLPDQEEVELPETGTYTLKVYDWQHEYRGSYAVGLEWIAPVAKQCDTLQIACGQVREGDIGQAAEADLLNFAGEAGDIVSITLAQTGEVDPSYWVRADLFAEGGTPVFDGFLPGRREEVLPDTGTYTLKVYDWQHEYRGSYAVGLECLAADVKVLDFWTDPPEVWVAVSAWVTVSAGEVKHNNGPEPATADAWWSIDGPTQVNVRWLAQPGDICTLDGLVVPCDDPGDINDLHFDVPLPVSETVPVYRDFEIHCKEEGTFVLTLGNEEWPIEVTDPDPTNNYLETQFTVHCISPTPTVRIGSGAAAPCTTGTVPIEVKNIPSPGVAALKIDILYDPGVVEAISCAMNPEWDLAECSVHYEHDGIAPDVIRCTALEAAGMVGDALVGECTFHCVGEACECTPLELVVVNFADPDANPMPVIPQNGEFCCLLLGDVDCDCMVDIVDALFVLQHDLGLRDCAYECPLPPGTLDCRAADVNCDGEADIVDALFILQCDLGLRDCNFVCP